MADSQHTSLYLYYDKSDFLLYVGITSRGVARNREHDRGKEWWPYVARQEVEHLPSRVAALDRERALIQRHAPPFNVQHNSHHEAMRETYLAVRQISPTAEPSPKTLGNRIPLRVVGASGDRVTLASVDELPFTVHGLSPKLQIAGAKRATCVSATTVNGYLIASLRHASQPPADRCLAMVAFDSSRRSALLKRLEFVGGTTQPA